MIKSETDLPSLCRNSSETLGINEGTRYAPDHHAFSRKRLRAQ